MTRSTKTNQEDPSEALLVVLTGAGISAESGIPTFRANGGLWRTYRYQDLATPEAFAKHPDVVWDFYRWRQETVRKAVPNAGHEALHAMERLLGKRMVLISQNVDDLHERAGSTDVIHIHGEIMKARCTRCQSVLSPFDYQDGAMPCPRCRNAKSLRPHIVWFGETPVHLEECQLALSRATVFMAVGTSGTVFPASDFVRVAREYGAFTVLVNLDAADNDHAFHRTLQGKAATILSEMVQTGGTDLFGYFRRLQVGN